MITDDQENGGEEGGGVTSGEVRNLSDGNDHNYLNTPSSVLKKSEKPPITIHPSPSEPIVKDVHLPSPPHTHPATAPSTSTDQPTVQSMEIEFNNARDYELSSHPDHQRMRRHRHRNQLHHIFSVLKIKLKRFFTCKCFRGSHDTTSDVTSTIEASALSSKNSKKARRRARKGRNVASNTPDQDIPSYSNQQQPINISNIATSSSALTDQNHLPDSLENLDGSKRGCEVAVPGGDSHHHHHLHGCGGVRSQSTVITIPSVQKNDIAYQTQRTDSQPYLDQLSRMQSLYQSEASHGKVSKQTSYQLARTLSHSEQISCKRKSIDLYKDLLKEEKNNRDILMELGSTYYKVEDYQNALKYSYKILDINPLDNQAITLKYMSQNAIKEQLKKNPSSLTSDTTTPHRNTHHQHSHHHRHHGGKKKQKEKDNDIKLGDDQKKPLHRSTTPPHFISPSTTTTQTTTTDDASDEEDKAEDTVDNFRDDNDNGVQESKKDNVKDTNNNNNNNIGEDISDSSSTSSSNVNE